MSTIIILEIIIYSPHNTTHILYQLLSLKTLIMETEFVNNDVIKGRGDY